MVASSASRFARRSWSFSTSPGSRCSMARVGGSPGSAPALLTSPTLSATSHSRPVAILAALAPALNVASGRSSLRASGGTDDPRPQTVCATTSARGPVEISGSGAVAGTGVRCGVGARTPRSPSSIGKVSASGSAPLVNGVRSLRGADPQHPLGVVHPALDALHLIEEREERLRCRRRRTRWRPCRARRGSAAAEQPRCRRGGPPARGDLRRASRASCRSTSAAAASLSR